MDRAAVQVWIDNCSSPTVHPQLRSLKRRRSPAGDRLPITPPSDSGSVPAGSETGSVLSPSVSGTPSCKRQRSSGSSDTSRSKHTNTAGARYRSNVLHPNGVFISSHTHLVPPDILAGARRILDMQRELVPAERLATWCREIVLVQDEPEDELADTLGRKLEVLPPSTYHQALARRTRQPFSDLDVLLPRCSLPPSLANAVPRISTPIPDVTYGLLEQSFTSEQMVLMTCPPISTLARPIPDLFWPFMTVEFKAQARGGTIFAATNQCAGSGSSIVKAFRSLIQVVSPTPTVEKRLLASAIAFSCAVDGRTAELFVHTVSEDGKTYHVSTVDRYLLADSSHIARLSKHAHNIVDWGVGARMDAVRELLDLRWDSANQSRDFAREHG